MNKTKIDFATLCRRLNRPAVYVRQLQQTLALPVHEDGERYTSAYEAFLRGIVSLRVCGISIEDISALLDLEKKLLQLLHVDTLSDSPTWYLDGCGGEMAGSCLLLTGYNLGDMIAPGAVQANLDFSQRAAELFSGKEMGEDARKVYQAWQERAAAIRARVESEIPALRRTVAWAARVGIGTR